MWALPALGAALLASFNPILYKRLLTQASPIVVVWSVLGLALPLLTLSTLASTPTWPGVDGVFLLATTGSAMLNALAHLASARSLQSTDASLVAPLLTFSPAFTVLLSALFLGETPGIRGLLGVGLVLLGAYWLNHGPGDRGRVPFQALALKPGVGLVLLAGLMWAITPVFEKLAIQHTFPTSSRFTALVVTGLIVILLTPFALRHVLQGGSPDLNSLIHRREWLLATSIAGIAPAFGYTAMSLGPVGYVTTLFRLSAVFTVIWSAWLLREPGFRQRLPASLLMVTGAVLIAV